MANNIFCGKCGTENSENSKYCFSCGEELHKTVDVNYEIKGGNLPFVTIKLNHGDRVFSESGSMAWRTNDIKMETTSNGGAEKVFSRILTHESLFQNIYTAMKDNQEISFASSFPGSILSLDIEPGKEVICQKSSFLVGTSGVNLSIHFNKKIGTGLFNGEGFIMQKISGTGKVFIEIDGSIEEKVLAKDEKIIISSGHLVMMDATCSIDVETISGFKNIFFGGEGLFNTVITGPGRVVLQSMPIGKMANTISGYLPVQSSSSNSN